MALLSESTRKAAWDLIEVAESHYHLSIKGGLIGMSLLQSAKGYKIPSGQARELFRGLWNRTDWKDRDSVLRMAPFIVRAYGLVPQNLLHEKLDAALHADGLRIRNGELRRIVTPHRPSVTSSR